MLKRGSEDPHLAKFCHYTESSLVMRYARTMAQGPGRCVLSESTILQPCYELCQNMAQDPGRCVLSGGRKERIFWCLVIIVDSRGKYQEITLDISNHGSQHFGMQSSASVSNFYQLTKNTSLHHSLTRISSLHQSLTKLTSPHHRITSLHYKGCPGYNAKL